MRFINSFIFVFLIICNIVHFSSLSKANESGVDGEMRYINNTIEKVLPEAYSSFRAEFRNDLGVHDANASIMLIVQAREFMEKATGSKESYKNAADAYRATWVISLRIWKNTTDQAAKELILNAWNHSLKEETQVPSQICSLVEKWDRNLLTDSFWQLFYQTEDRKIISAICYVISTHDNKMDEVRLKAKRDDVIDPELKEIIQNALNWMKFWRAGDPSTPGPAASPPTLVR